jgi:hypothetical protein
LTDFPVGKYWKNHHRGFLGVRQLGGCLKTGDALKGHRIRAQGWTCFLRPTLGFDTLPRWGSSSETASLLPPCFYAPRLKGGRKLPHSKGFAKGLAYLLEGLAAFAFARLIRDGETAACRPAIAGIFPFQADCFYRFPATALARIGFAPFARAIIAASAKNSGTLLNSQKMHCRKGRAAIALARLISDKVAFAVIFAVADIIRSPRVCRNERPDYSKQQQATQSQNDCLFHSTILLIVNERKRSYPVLTPKNHS